MNNINIQYLGVIDNAKIGRIDGCKKNSYTDFVSNILANFII